MSLIRDDPHAAVRLKILPYLVFFQHHEQGKKASKVNLSIEHVDYLVPELLNVLTNALFI